LIAEIKQTLDFIVEIEKLKDVLRKTRPVGLERFENSAEHSWHVCISALMLKDYANEAVDIDRVIKMLLIHDLGEIDAGDTIVYASMDEKAAQAILEEETKGVERLLDFLPKGKKEEYLTLWQEFEAGETPESKYAKAIDRVPPLLHNLHGKGRSWDENKVSKEMVFSVNKRIAKGSTDLWQVIEEKLNDAVKEGILK
jgi:putative hydrolase of HD superfamily